MSEGSRLSDINPKLNELLRVPIALSRGILGLGVILNPKFGIKMVESLYNNEKLTGALLAEFKPDNEEGGKWYVDKPNPTPAT
ncbi:MAG: hypothetical protein NZL93_06780 [Chthoniobacterales bacterium]|nr:hypothetical protein [Chthoniobacterales bacterium]